MPNTIKESGEGYALQVTQPARDAGLVEEDSEGDPLRRADVRVHGFDGLLLVVDVDRVDEAAEAELVAVAARDSGAVYRALEATVQQAGNGYQVQLPAARDAGFAVGDSALARPARGVLFVHPNTADGERLAADLRSIREEQVRTQC